MSKSRIAPLLAVAAAITIAGCSSGTTTTPSTVTVTPPNSAAPTWPAPPARDEPTVLQMQLGERASTGCPADQLGQCDVEFAINAIYPHAQCVDDYGSSIGPDEQMLGFDIEVWTAQQFNDPNVGMTFFLDNWGVASSTIGESAPPKVSQRDPKYTPSLSATAS